jgi:ribose-phosphate pyrophosphokinase
MAYTARKTGAQEVVMVMPYLPYNRQERKANAHDPISAKVVAKALAEAAGVTRLISLDLHAAATEGFFDVPMQHITAQHLLVEWIRQNMSDSLGDMVPVAPDAGRAKATKKLGEELGLNAPPATVNKFRPRPGVAAVTGVVGNVSGKTALLYDDIIDTGGSILGAAQALITAGARQVCVVATHGVFAASEIELDAKGQTELARIKTFLLQPGKREGDYIKYSIDGKKFFVNALVRLQADPNIHRIVFTDSLFCPPQNIIDEGKVAVVSISCLLAEVCARIIRNQTLVDIQYAS